MELHVNIAGSCMLILSYGSLYQYSRGMLVCRFLFLCGTVFVCFWFRLILAIAAAAAKSLQSCPTLCNPIDSSTPGSPIPGTLQARTLEWVAISFSSAWKWKVKVKSLSRVRLLATHGLQPTRLLHPWDLPGKRTGVGCHHLLLILAT